MMWKRLMIALCLSLGLVGSALADSPAPAVGWSRHTGEYLFVMLAPGGGPMVMSGGGTYSQSGLYRYPGPTEPLWTVPFYAYESEIFLTEDGRHLVRLGPWPSGGNYDEVAVQFWQDGSLLKGYRVRDLVAAPEKLPRSVSHYEWRDYAQTRFALYDARLTLVTLEGVTYGFDARTGEMLGAPTKAESPLNPAWMALGALLPLAALVAGLALRKRSLR